MLNPSEVRAVARKPITFGVLASNDEFADDVQEFLFPPPHSAEGKGIVWIADEADFPRATLGFSEAGIPHPSHFFRFDPNDPRASAGSLLDDDATDDLLLPLARNFPGFRGPVSERLIWKSAKENTLFTAATSLPNIVPSVLSLPWAVGEFASDTAFLTMNQVRLSFLIAAAHGRAVGYDRQSLPIGSILAAALGWRALAREAASKMPGGCGVLSKALIAFAGTYAVGKGLEHWFREGSPIGRLAELEHYSEGFRRGKDTVERIVKGVMSASRPAERSA